MEQPPVRSDNPFAAPLADVQAVYEPRLAIHAGPWRAGNRLVMLKQSQLPPLCVKSGEPAEDWLRRKYVWCPPIAYVGLLAGLLPAIILILVLQKKGTVDVPVTAEIRHRRRNLILLSLAFAAMSIVSLVAGIAMASQPGDNVGYFLVGLFAFFGLLIAALAVGNPATAILKPTKITDQHMWFKGVHPNVLETLPPWNPDNGYRP